MIYLCDTCVLIDYLRGKTEVQQKLEQDKELELGLPLYTTNIKDFQFIPDLILV